MIALVDYGMGNLKSVSKGLEAVGGKVCVTHDFRQILKADKVVLPGVGAFQRCMENLSARDLIEPLYEVLEKGRIFLGICLGLQLLFEESEEFGSSEGLGFLRGRVRRFESTTLKIPHMGWNQIIKHGDPLLFRGVPDGTSFYFVHSYYVEPKTELVATSTEYGSLFCSSIEKDNLFACQFHPEKSQGSGLKVLENFVKL